MKSSLITLLLALLLAAPAAAGPVDRAARDAVEAGAPGALARTAAGRSFAVGRASLQPARRARAADRFRAGSITKTFVATVVLQLVEEGRLSLDERVPEGPTVRELLSHTSGLAEYGAHPEILRSLEDPSFTWTGRGLADLALTLPPAGPGFHYANTNYVLLGLTVERVTGRRLPLVLRDRILRPLKLRDTAFDLTPGIEGRHLHGYVGELLDTDEVSPSYAWAAGALVSSTRDLARFQRALMRGELLGRKALRAMRTPVSGPYGLGLFRVKTPCGTAFGHNGELLGTLSFALASRDGRRVAVAAVNRQGLDREVLELARAAYCR